ncbi:unnamed protein product [Pleuronectes platessa]|uniref:Uncharacterized protein n=1 Tax=Pleuronectes platessa TaxID=8262 RepID=A0A9N7YG81_PLEPL|nr:unnamed protein product [Pleuronectes platessa]
MACSSTSVEEEAATCAKLTDLFGAGFTSPAAAGAPGDERGGLDNDERVEADVVSDLRKPVAATAPQEIMCLCVWPRRFPVLPGTTLPEPPLSLVILARCLAGNQPSGPLSE